jgi:hypothetical protein
MRRITLVVFALAILAVPSAGLAKAPKPPKAPETPCQPHAVAYKISGNLVSGALTPGSGKNRYSGDLTVDVKKTNRHAKADKNTTQTYTLTNAKLKLHGEDPALLTPGSRVKLKGTITKLGKKCDQTGFVPTRTIKSGTIKPPKTP